MKLSTILLPMAIVTGALAAPTDKGSLQAVGIKERQSHRTPGGTTPLSADIVEVDVDVNKRGVKANVNVAFYATPILGCMQPWQAQAIVNAFNYLLANPQAANFNATANALLSNDFTDTSDSIDQLAGIPEGSVTFASKAAFIAGSGSQPPLYLSTLDLFNSCNKISWRWISNSGTGNNKERVKGIDNFYINQQGQIESTYAEFNSGAWLADLGAPAVIDN